MRDGLYPPDEILKNIEVVFTDIDDTLTRDGLLLPEAFTSIWKLSENGISVIPVTGRPAGWCDCIIRQWPVKAVIGENGAFAVYIDENKQLQTLVHPSVPEDDVDERLKAMGEAVLDEVPLARIAKDQPYRRFDLAIDFAEDPPVLGLDEAGVIKKVCERMGGVAKISSIHVNAWFGDYNKLAMVQLFAEKQLGLGGGDLTEKAIFCGDSPNDEPMFGFFPYSFGMANIGKYWELLNNRPGFVTDKPFGYGFAEVAEKLLSYH